MLGKYKKYFQWGFICETWNPATGENICKILLPKMLQIPSYRRKYFPNTPSKKIELPYTGKNSFLIPLTYYLQYNSQKCFISLQGGLFIFVLGAGGYCDG